MHDSGVMVSTNWMSKRRTLQLSRRITLATLISGLVLTAQLSANGQAPAIHWRDALKQTTVWYASNEAIRIADNLIIYQRDSGGWPKNIDMATVLTDVERENLRKQKAEADSTIDNEATYTQAIFLARVFRGAKLERHRQSFIKAFDYLLAAQYKNGGWPQYFPIRAGYYQHITFNDDAMIGVLRLLREVAQRKPDYLFVDDARRARARQAVEKGIECILKTQVVVRGTRTVWCAQYDEVTLAPAPARTYELVSLSGQESVGIVEFLLGIERPDARVIGAIEAAVNWFRSAEISGMRWVQTAGPPVDRVVIADPKAPPLWARFYEIESNRPFFSGRDGIIKYNVAEIESERRNGYRWYTDAPAKLLDKDYPAWKSRVAARRAAAN